MPRFKERVNCTNPDFGQPAEIEFTEATRKLRFTCLSCGQLNQVEIILSTDQGGPRAAMASPKTAPG